jgi:hypothetical protein
MSLLKFLKKLFPKRPACAGRKIALFSVFSFLFLVIFSKPLLAYPGSTLRGGYYSTFENAVYQTEEMNLQSFVNETFKALAGSVFTTIVGCTNCSSEEREKYPGLLSSLGGLTSSIYANPPASTRTYIAYLSNKMGIAKPVYAQGTGFEQMSTILPIWRAFRDLSYAFFVIIFIFTGFAIMFRIKISPQAVVTIESALPKLIIALILVTFSYAIVGFMIDIAYVLIALINNVFVGTGGIFEKEIGGIAAVIAGWAKTSSGSPAWIIFNDAIFLTNVLLLALMTALTFGPFGILFVLIIGIVILIAVLRCFWTLLKAYAMIIISLIFAPFQIIIGALPGSNAISSWFRNLLANIAVLPTMIAMFFLASYLILAGLKPLLEPTTLILTFLGTVVPFLTTTLQMIYQGLRIISDPMDFFNSTILSLIGLIILLLAPKVADIIQSFISGKPFAYGAAIGEAITTPPSMLFRYGVGTLTAGTKIGEAWTTRMGLRPPPTGSGGDSSRSESSTNSSYPGAPPSVPSV